MSFKSKVVVKLGFKCKCCEEYFESKNFLNGHLATKHRKFPCYKCNEAFEDQNLLIKHLSTCQGGIHDVVPCGRVNLDEFSRENQTKNSQIKESGLDRIKADKGVKCSHCEKTFKRKEILKKHLRSEHNRKLLCHKCTEGFEDQKSLAEHLSKSCTEKQKMREVYPCEQCEKVLLSSISYERHIKICTLVKCHKCEKKFSTFCKLKAHIKTNHEPKQTFDCDKCEKSYLTKRKLEDHVNYAHNPIFAFKCHRCETAYTGEYNLIHHMSMKHRDCPICGKVFTRMEDLKAHFEEQHPELCNKPNLPFAFDSDNFLSVKKEIKEEISDETLVCNKIKLEDQTFEMEKLRQSNEALKKELEQRLTENTNLVLENDSLKSQNQSLTLKLSSLEELMKLKETIARPDFVFHQTK